jgi:3-oxoacyl-[acyl-carrier protein] reductase
VNGHHLLEGKVVVITAAAGTGIGGAAARRCLEEGARVVISDQYHQRLAATRAELARAHGDRVWSQPCDVTDEAQVQALIEAAADHFGRIDVLVNNAGLGGTASVLDMTDEQWFRVLDVTLTGTFRCTRAALRQMVAQGHGGAVVNNASVLGWRAQPGQAHYAAAKAGVMALTRCAALDVAPHGIRVNAVAPQPGHPPLPEPGQQCGPPRRPGPPRSLRPRRRTPRSRQRHRLPGQRLRELHDRRGDLGQRPAP